MTRALDRLVMLMEAEAVELLRGTGSNETS